MRHLEVKDLWLQALVKDGRVTLRKIPGSYNVSDVLTKYSDKACCTRLLGRHSRGQRLGRGEVLTFRE